MECPRCNSTEVARLPPSQISPHPGYHCQQCGLKMRSHGMFYVYLFFLLFGLVVSAIPVIVFLIFGEDEKVLKTSWLLVAGLVVCGYSAMQIARPTPRGKPNETNTRVKLSDKFPPSSLSD